MPVREVSERLAAIGRPILPSGITKIEKGQRRIDVDDLLALAEVLGVTPTHLLYDNPRQAQAYEPKPPTMAEMTATLDAWIDARSAAGGTRKA